MEQHVNNIKSIHDKEFKAVLKELVKAGEFPKDILFNGAKKEYILLPYELQEELSRKFKSYVNENIIYCQTHIVEYILNKNYEDENTPFHYDEILNQTYLDTLQIIEDIIYYLNNENYEEDLYLLNNLGECSQDDKDLLKNFLDEVNLKISEEDLYKMDFEELNKKVEDYLKELHEDDLKELLEDNSFNWGLSIEDYHNQTEVYEWWLVSSWLHDLLNYHGEVVLNGNYWGRCTTGQSIELDGVIQNIFLKWWCE